MDDFISVWLNGLLLNYNFLLMIVMFGGVGLLERYFPAHPVTTDHYNFNVAYGVVNAVAIAAVMPFLSAGIATLLQATGSGWIDPRPLGAPGVAIALLSSILLADVLLYALHRLQHASDILWQEHLLHHCDENLNVTTASRTHILDIFLSTLFVTIPLALLFRLEPFEIGLLTMLPVAWNYFAHVNLRVGFGPLWWLVTSPQYHRIHHSLEARHRDRNFALWFPLWDILFGTAYPPRPGEYSATGVEGVRVGTIPDAYLQPFRGWRRMLASRRCGSPDAADPAAEPRRP